MSFDPCLLELSPLTGRTCDRAAGHDGPCMYGSGEEELEDILQDWRDRFDRGELELEDCPPLVRGWLASTLELEEEE